MSSIYLQNPTAQSELAGLLQSLQQLYPVKGWVYVGAGDGAVLEQGCFANVDNLLAIEADETQHNRLVARTLARHRWRVVHALVGQNNAEHNFYAYSNSRENSLLSPEALAPLWKNLRLKTSTKMQTSSLSSLLTQTQSQDYNWLTLDCLPALPLLQGLAGGIAAFDVIQVRIVKLADPAITQVGGDHAAVEHFMQQQGFKALLESEETNAALASVLYVRDWKAVFCKEKEGWQQDKIVTQKQYSQKISELNESLEKGAEDLQKKTQDLQKKTQELQELSEQKKRIEQSHADTGKQLADARVQLATLNADLNAAKQALADSTQQSDLVVAGLEKEKKNLQASLEKGAEDLQKKTQELQELSEQKKRIEQSHADTEKLNKTLEQTAEQIRQQKEAQQTLTNTIALLKTELLKKLEKQTDELAWVNENLDTSIKREVAGATQHLTVMAGVQNYFTSGLLPIVNGSQQNTHSAEYCLYLIEQIECNTYDLVIEFGAGTSTLAIAQAMSKGKKRPGKKSQAQIVSFHHLPENYQQVLSRLQQTGLDKVVQLILSPLQEWQAAETGAYPYYACQEQLANIASKTELAGLRVLVIVNKLSDESDIMARYPAGPIVMQYFAGALIEMVVGNATPEAEAKLLQCWQEEVKVAGFSAQTSAEQSINQQR